MSPVRTFVSGIKSALLGRFLAWALAVSAVILQPAGAGALPPAPPNPKVPGGPADVGAEWTPGEVAAPVLPEPPSHYRSERRGQVQWVYPDNMVDETRRLQGTFDRAWRRIGRDLGTELDPGMVIRIARSPEEMRELAPRGHPPPKYATGVAYPPFGVVLLTLTAPESWKRPDLESVLTHELSHIALWRAVDGNALPRWFVEGVAIHQAGEYSLPRMRALWEATVQDGILPLEQLSERFPSRPNDVNVAYAQAADIVNFLRKDEVDTHRFHRLIRQLRQGEHFGQALENAYFISLRDLESEWHANLQKRFQALPLLLGGGTVWALAGLFVVVGYVRRKRRAKRKLRAWAEEEAEIDRIERTAARAATPAPQQQDDDERVVIVVSGDPPQGREPDVPTIEYEGRDHTLH